MLSITWRVVGVSTPFLCRTLSIRRLPLNPSGRKSQRPFVSVGNAAAQRCSVPSSTLQPQHHAHAPHRWVRTNSGGKGPACGWRWCGAQRARSQVVVVAVGVSRTASVRPSVALSAAAGRSPDHHRCAVSCTRINEYRVCKQYTKGACAETHDAGSGRAAMQSAEECGRARGSRRWDGSAFETGARRRYSLLLHRDRFLPSPLPHSPCFLLCRMRTCSALRRPLARPTAAVPVRRAKPQSRKWQSEDSVYGHTHGSLNRVHASVTDGRRRACGSRTRVCDAECVHCLCLCCVLGQPNGSSRGVAGAGVW